MPITSVATVAAGDTITAARANTDRDNTVVLDGRTGGDPGASAGVLKRSTNTTGTWGTVATSEITDLAVTTGKINDLAVTTGKINDLAVTNGKIANSTISGDAKLVSSSITGNSGGSAIGTGAIHANRIQGASFDATQVASAFADASISGTKLIDTSIPSGKLGTGAVITTNIADGNVTAAKLASGVAAVPSGLIAAFATASAIASGWAQYTAGDGRMLVGAGTTFGVTYVENTAYGASWSHLHTGPSHSHSLSAAGVSGNTGQPSALNGLGNGGGTNTPSTTHTHDQGSLDVTGSTDADGTGNTGGTAWVIPSHAVVWAQKS